uniref:Ig-like domain-containing protein n=1 Tax=Vombatus ursinus TaxID=29139 RepID=A0A4X2M036_VOMUR
MEKALGALSVVFCLHLDWVSSQDKIEQSPPSLSVQMGENITMTCSYTVSNFKNLQWYRQYPGKGPRILLTVYSKAKWEGRFRAILEKEHSDLYILTSQPGDSGTYLCAVGPQRSPNTCSLCTNLAGGAQA